MKDQSIPDCVRLLKQVSDIEPPPEALQRALEKTRKAIGDRRSPTAHVVPVSLGRSGYRLLRFVVAAAAILVVAFGGAFVVFITPSGATSAFAEMQAAIERVSYVSCTIRVLGAPNDQVAKSGTQLIDLDRNRYRFESAGGEEIGVSDVNRGIFLLLYPMQKRAFVKEDASAPQLASFTSFLNALRDCDPAWVEKVNDAMFEGRRVERYRVLPEAPISGGAYTLVSVDPDTHLPVRIECTADISGEPLRVESNNFSYDQLDPNLFATVPPKGYQVDGDIDSAGLEVAVNTQHPGPSETDTHSWGLEGNQDETQFSFGQLATNKSGEAVPTLEFRLADTTRSDIFVQPAKLDIGIDVYMQKTPILTADDFWAVTFIRRPDRVTELQLDVEKDAAVRLAAATQKHLEKFLVVTLDGKIILAPMIRGKISTKTALSGTFSDETLSQLFKVLILNKSHPPSSAPLAPVRKVE
jgi:hypothetical protein